MGLIESPERFIVTPDDLEFIHEHSPVGDYFTIEDEGRGVLLHDVVTRQPLQQGIPQGILRVKDLYKGVEFLRTLGRKDALTVELILAPHGSADDYRQIAQAFPDTLDDAQIIGVERSWRRPNRAYLPEAVRPEFAPEGTGRNEFQVEQFFSLHAKRKTVLPCELALNDGSIVATELQRLWDDIYLPLKAADDMSPAMRNAALTIAENAYQAVRQPAIVATFGRWLLRLNNIGRLSQYANHIPLMVGRLHEADKTRFDGLGVEVNVHKVPYSAKEDTPDYIKYGRMVIDTQRTGRADLAFLETPRPY